MSLPLRAFDVDRIDRLVRRLRELAAQFAGAGAIRIAVIDEKGAPVNAAAELTRLAGELEMAARPSYVQPADRQVGPPRRRPKRQRSRR